MRTYRLEISAPDEYVPVYAEVHFQNDSVLSVYRYDFKEVDESEDSLCDHDCEHCEWVECPIESEEV